MNPSPSPQFLFIALLGGKHAKAHVEVHDVIPFISSDVTSAFPYLKQQWFGMEKGVHLDAWMKINGVHYEGINYHIQIQDFSLSSTALKLYLINLGGYVATEFGEVHKYIVVAGKNKTDAKQQGKKHIESHWLKPHTDTVIEVDDCIEISQLNGQSIQLIEGEFEENSFKNDYIVLP